MEYSIKNYNGKIFSKSEEAANKEECFKKIFSIYNRGRYTISILWLHDSKLNEEFWGWTRELSIGEYYKLNGKID